MKRKLLIILIVILSISLLTGCWDRKDIETRGYVLGVAIDKNPASSQKADQNQLSKQIAEKKEKMDEMEDMDIHLGSHQYAMTVQLPILRKSGSGSQAGSGSGSGAAGKATLEITQIGNSFFSMQREMLSRTSLSLYYEHLQVIVLSEEVAREGVEEIIDFFVRDPEMRRRVKVFVSKDEAKAVLSVEPMIEEFSSIYLANIPLNARSNSRIIHKTDLGEIIKLIHAGVDFVLPMVQIAENEIKASAGAAFKDNKMVGWVSELEMESIKLIRNLYLGGVITVLSPEHGQGIIALEVTSAKSKITPVIVDDEVTFNIDIKIKGNYAENMYIHTHAELDDSFMHKLEKAYEKEVEKMCQNTAKRMQIEYGADVFRLNQILQTEEPAYWKEMADHWDLMYPHVGININVDVSLQLIGLVK